MPIYHYQCVDCEEIDLRVGGIDDQTALCLNCGSLMLRQDVDVFQPYFDNKERVPGLAFPMEKVLLFLLNRPKHGEN